MRMRRCWACGRRRPLKRLARETGPDADPALVVCRNACGRAGCRYEAHICRLILGDHDQWDRTWWRKRLARHRELASRRVSLHAARA